MQPSSRTAMPPAIRGEPDVAQGAYGQRGNLELIAPAADDGFVVLWFNGDDETGDRQPDGPPPRSWSAPLHVRTGGRLDGARIAQVPYGPDFLEAVVRAGDRLQRWTWMPGPGFVDGGPLPASGCTPSAPVAAGDGLHLLTTDGNAVLHHSSGIAGYPDLAWSASVVLTAPAPVAALDLVADGDGLAALVVAGGRAWRLRRTGSGWAAPERVPGAWTAARLPDAAGPVVGLGPDGRVRAGAAPSVEAVDAVAAVRSSLDGGTIEVVARRGADLLHARVPATGEQPRFRRIVPLQRIDGS